jgi:Cysteine-rich secretory protein family
VGVTRNAACAAVSLCMLFVIPAAASAQQGDATDLVSSINAVRAGYGLGSLTMSEQLNSAAQGFADVLAETSTFGHVSPDGRTLADRVGPTGYLTGRASWILSENLAWESRPLSTPENVTSEWLNSPSHRENLLDPDLREVGIGIADGTPAGMHQPGTYYVADFGAPYIALPVSPTVAAPAPAKRRARAHRVHRQARAQLGLRRDSLPAERPERRARRRVVRPGRDRQL